LASKIRETVIERYLVTQCRKNGFLCLKFTSPARGGVPDRLIISPSGTPFVELKKPGEKPDRRQRETHAKMRRYGAEIYVIDSRAGVDDLMENLRARAAQHPEGVAS